MNCNKILIKMKPEVHLLFVLFTSKIGINQVCVIYLGKLADKITYFMNMGLLQLHCQAPFIFKLEFAG